MEQREAVHLVHVRAAFEYPVPDARVHPIAKADSQGRRNILGPSLWHAERGTGRLTSTSAPIA